MRTGIRQKIMVLLTVTALLPLLAALAVILTSFGQLRLDTLGQTLQALASANANGLEVSLTKDLERIHGVFSHNSVIDAVLSAATKRPEKELKELDRLWPALPESDPRVAGAIRHPQLAALLRQLIDEDPRIAAASEKTEDFDQSDDPWWIASYNDGLHLRVYVPPIGRDVSANTWSVDLVVPINDGERFQGIVKVVMKLTGWLGRVDRMSQETPIRVSLVKEDGGIVFVDDPERGQSNPAGGRVALGKGETLDTRHSSWRRAPGGTLQAFSPIRLETRLAEHELVCPTWLLSLELSESKVLAPTYDRILAAAGIGLTLILGVFVVGLVLAEKGLVRRIRALRAVSHEIAAGDLTQRVPIEARRRFGVDELDDLAADFNHMIDQMAHSYAVLRNANAMKTNFIRIAGHELRTPVSYILAMARLLRDATDIERFRHGVSAMAAKAHRLEAIIQAIFKLLPEQGGQTLRPEPVRVSEILENVYADCHPFVERRGQRLVVECDALPEIQADRGKLRDAIEQLTMNAVKFTPDGGTVRIRAVEQQGEYIAISVTDQGAGIPPEALPNIFEPFYSGADSLKHSSGTEEFKKQGIGLGLTVARHFAELHGGTVQVATGPEGCTFTLIVPIRQGSPPESASTGAGI
ncbi:MAG: HAMP domain-containing sensor histidine kinase [Planctomycetota bacterium]|nr:HAMP domain-containing sensor histidine kinase [Planctomycetota bacterium]